MTDKEVQKLNRKELLQFLLDAQTENESLRRDRSELRKQVRQLEEQLEEAKELRPDTEVQAAAILQETPAAPDQNAETVRLREAQVEQEQRLQDWELRLRQKENLLAQQEAGVKKLIAAADGEAARYLQEASTNANETRRLAEESSAALRKSASDQASETVRSAEAAAAETIRKAEDAAAMILRNAENAARETERKAASDAERILQHAQEDSDSFWQDVTALLQKKLFSDGGAADGQ